MFKTEPTFSTPEITPEIAQAIYGMIKEYGDADSAYKSKGNSDYEPEHFEIVDKELERLVNQLNSMKSGSYIIEPAYPAVYDDEGNITEEAVEAVYLDAEATDTYTNYLTSELLNVETLIADLA